jgi:hypothetical protein
MTKKCPYCFEEIQLEAIKCKHCGEWLKNKSVSDIAGATRTTFDKARNFISDQIDKQQQKRNEHLFVPTANRPFEIRGLQFYDSYFTNGNEKWSYNQIASLYFFASRQTYNGILSETDNNLKLFIDSELNELIQVDQAKHDNVFDINISTGLFSSGNKKEREKIAFLFQLLSRATFESRLIRYINSLKRTGHFLYPPNVKIYNNGDVEKKGKHHNIGQAIKDSLLVYGNYELKGRNSYSDPFHFAIYETSGVKLAFAGFELSNKLSFEVYYDKDVFDALLGFYQKHGVFIN